ncbi:hypothetical protein B0H13DRAFT_2200535 [Mycena leptocephala]|nr:hypothetical protein B0H13DRAFT_2200535 [Mycena leptocephala]
MKIGSASLKNLTEVRGCQSDECALEADIYLRSSDGILFEAHSKNLELYSGGFPPANFADVGGDEREVVQMTETSSVLALLLQYVHNQRQPDSSRFQFETLAGLAEAAEKYLVFSAMEVCKIQMRLSIPTHPVRVLAYAAKHGYPELRDIAAPLTISASLQSVEAAMHDMPEILIAWVKYREGFIHTLHFLFKRPPIVLHRGGLNTCELWEPFQQEIVEKTVDCQLEPLKQFQAYVEDELHHLKDCAHCIIRARNWGRTVADRVDLLPLFSSSL